MKVVVTGAAGFLGQEVVGSLLRRGSLRGQELGQVVAVDLVASPDTDDPRVDPVAGDITEPGFLDPVLADADVVFHLAAVVSGQAEAEHDLGMRVNLDGTRLLLDACRAAGRAPIVVFASSLAVYGGQLPAVVDDSTPVRPESSYGTQKAIGELLVADYTRKGFLDGRALRLPTICVRPGRPNQAASSFLSGIIREPVAGTVAVCPVAPETVVWLASPQCAVDGLIAGAELESVAIGANRSVNVPGVSVSVGEMVETLGRLAGPAAAELVRWERDPRIERIVGTWPAAVDVRRAAALGLAGDRDFAALVEAHLRRLPPG
jgi:D-erythronate 2-dehydrogenase